MIKYISYISALIICMLVSAYTHPFYVSVCEMHHNTETQSIEISIRMFIDDIEDALEARGTEKLWIGDTRQSDKLDEYLQTYLNEGLQLIVNGERVSYTYVGRELEDELLWCYIEVEDIANITSIKVKNRLLMDKFESQTNVIHTYINGVEKSLILNSSESQGELSF